MVALSFSEPKHYDKLVKREKKQTIRPRNPKRIEQMKRLGIQIYWKQRTPQREKLYDAIYDGGPVVQFNKGEDGYDLCLVKRENGLEIFWFPFPPEMREKVAKADGFDNYAEMVVWFDKRYKDLDGKIFDLIRWNEVK